MIRTSKPLTAQMDNQAEPAVEINGDLERQPFHRLEVLLLTLLLLAAFAIRIYKLDSFPDTVLADEADNAQDAVRILYGQTPANGFFGLDWTSQPAFSAYKEAAFIYIFGFNIFAIRLSSAIISTLALIPFYLLLRRQLSMVASMLTTVLFATNVWYLNFSRSGWNCSDASFYMLMSMLFVMLALDAIRVERRSYRFRWFYFAASGFFCALGLYGYPAGRAVTVAMIAFVPIALLFYRRFYKSLLLGFGILFVVEAMVFAPQGIYVAKNWEHFNGRSNVVMIFNKEEFKIDPTSTMLRQLDRNIRSPWDGRVNNTPQYSPVGEPQLDRITGILVLIGMVLTLVSGVLRRQPETWLWWLMLLAGWGLTQLFTVNTPNGARGIGYAPTLIYFAGVSIDGILQAARRIPVRIREFSVLMPITQATLILLILFAGFNNIKHYIDWQNTPRTRQDRYLYVTAREFSQWSAAIVERAKNKQGIINVGQWRELHPIQDIAHPYPDSMP